MTGDTTDADNERQQAELVLLRQQVADLEATLAARDKEIEMLRFYEAHFRTVANFTYDWEYWIAPDGALIYVSPSCERITGYRADEFQADKGLLLRIVHPADHDRAAQHLHDEQHNQQQSEMNFRIITRSGEERWIGHICQPVYAPDGRWIGQRASNRDITRQVQLQAAYHAVVDHSMQALVILQDGRNVFVNPAAESITGYSREELLALSPEEANAIIAPADRARLAANLQARQAGHDVPPTYEFRLIRKDGAVRWIECYNTRIEYRGRPAVQMAYIDITERKTTEAALDESKALLQGILDHSPAAIYARHINGQQLLINRYVAELFGLNLEQTIGKHLQDTFAAELAERWYAQDQQVIAQNQVLEFEETVRLGDVVHTFLTIRFPIYDTQGMLFAVGGISTDITERKQAEEALRASEEKFRCFVDQSWDSIILIDDQGIIVDWNQSAERLTGLEHSQVIGRPAWDVNFRILPHFQQTPEIYAYLREQTQALLRPNEQPWMAQSSGQLVRQSDGAYRTVQEMRFSIQTGRGMMIGGVIRDISEQVQAEEALKESQRFAEQIANHAPYMIYVYDLIKGYNTYVNPYGLAFMGSTLEELQQLGQSLYVERLHADDREKLVQFREQWERAEDDQVFLREYRLLNAQGEWRWIRSYELVFQRGPDGQPTQIMGTAIDISGQIEIQEDLRASQSRLQAIFDNAAIGMALVAPDGRWLQINHVVLEMLGYTPEELYQMTCLDVVHPSDVAASRAHLQDLLLGEHKRVHLEHRYIRKDGTTFWGDLSMTAIRNAQDELETVVVILNDITDRKLAALQLQRANERLIQGIDRLRQHNYEATLLAQMGDLLQSCLNVDEAYEVIALIAGRVFNGQSGAFYVFHHERDLFEAVASWGERPPAETMFLSQECWALRQGHTYMFCETAGGLCCQHIHEEEPVSSLCVPLVAQGETIGLLHLRNGPTAEHESRQRWQDLAETVAGHLAMALTNLSLRERLQQQAIHDSLTGLFNRRYLDETLRRELQRAARHQRPVGIIMLDIDHFKRFNDIYGHDAGDTLLKAVGAFLQSNTRGDDIACRYGGEEFMLVLPGASLETTRQRAEELRTGMKELRVQHLGHPLESAAISLGVAIFPDHGRTDDTLIKAADTALYQAKAAGRDCVIVGTMPMVQNTNALEQRQSE